jgi:heme exporter protein D
MNSWSEFIHMGGYAWYVWPSYALGLIVFVANVLAPLARRKQVMRDLARKIQREEKQ